MSDEDTDNDDDVEDPTKRRNTTESDRRVIFFACRASMEDGRPKRGIFQELADLLGFKRKAVSRQWNQMAKKMAPLLDNQDEEDHARIIHDNAHILFATGASSRRAGKYKYDRDELKVTMKAMPLKQRKTIRKTAGRLAIPKSSLQDIMRPRLPWKLAAQVQETKLSAVLVRHKSRLKPTLTELNKLSRYNFCLEQINRNTLGLQRPKYNDQMDKVHVDEKWFHLIRDGEKYILCDDEEPPKRHTKHKSYIGKVMFLCAQARPRWDPTSNSMWDGKIGIWPIGKYTLAQRASIN
jgi:hypothetical protein